MIVGAAIVIGAVRFPSRNMLLAIGAAAAALATTLFAARLAAPFGLPTLVQVASLAIAVVIEMIALAWAIRRYAPRGERASTIAILAIVGLHFLLMAPAFGAPIVLLGALNLANALAGARWPTYPMRALWGCDGALKFGIGALMLAAAT